MNRLCKVLANSALVAMFAISGNALAWQATPAKDKTAKTTTSKAAPTDADIADAKAKGLVWVNTSTKVYHKSGDRYFGKTKQGQFMTEADAQKAGYRAAEESGSKKKSTDATTATTGSIKSTDTTTSTSAKKKKKKATDTDK